MSDTNALKKLCRTMITAFDRVDGTYSYTDYRRTKKTLVIKLLEWLDIEDENTQQAIISMVAEGWRGGEPNALIRDVPNALEEVGAVGQGLRGMIEDAEYTERAGVDTYRHQLDVLRDLPVLRILSFDDLKESADGDGINELLKMVDRGLVDQWDGTAPAGEQFEDAGYPAGGM